MLWARSLVIVGALAAAATAAPPAPLSVEVHGHGPPLLLIPGLSCGGDVWRATVARYAATHELHVVTLAGFAGQPAVAGPLLEPARRALADYIRAHGLTRPVVIGHSLGGVLALWLAATEPSLVGGVVVTTRNATLPGIGAGYTLGYVYILAVKNPMVYAPESFFNDAIASLFGLMMSGVAFMIIPTVIGTAWLRRRQLAQLRRQVVFAATAPLQGILYAFESVNRDLYHQIVQFTKQGGEESRGLLSWALAVHDCGRAIIELRQDMAHEDLPPPVVDSMQRVVDSMAHLYDAPDKNRWQAAYAATDHAITLTSQTLPQARASCQPALAHLLQLRIALRDDESALAPYIVKAPENTHAA